MTTKLRRIRSTILLPAMLTLTACLSDDPVEEEVAEAATAISFTNIPETSVIQTPDIVVNLTGTVSSEIDVDVVTWQNDRGGKGTANGKNNWATGNIVLQLGTNNITITVADTKGAKLSKSVTVERENTAPAASQSEEDEPILMYSYDSTLGNAAPVKNATIRRGQVYFFVDPGVVWTDRGLSSIRIRCCKGQAGPGEGEGYEADKTVTGPAWAERFDLSGFEPGGTRRVRIQATFDDNSESDAPVFDFTVEQPDEDANTAPMISGSPQLGATAGVQYSFRPVAEDPDGDTMQFNVDNIPGWASFNSTTGRLFGTPTANDVGLHENIVISVSDGEVSSSLPAFDIEVVAFSNGTATLTWTIPTERTDNTPLDNLEGFHIYFGQSSGDYANKITVNNSTISNYMVDNLGAGRWYFVVTAFDSDGLESNPSNEGSKAF